MDFLNAAFNFKTEIGGRLTILRKADKTPIYLPESLFEGGRLSSVKEVIESCNGAFNVRSEIPETGGWALSWASPTRARRNAVMETGFWWHSFHIDMEGIYQKSPFNRPEVMADILAYQAPISVVDLVLDCRVPLAKFLQGDHAMLWDGVVLPLQIPRDRSVLSVGTELDYWRFVEGACREYGSELLLKEHPLQGPDARVRAAQIANDFHARYAQTNLSVLQRCRFVLTYNSSFCVDAWINSTRVAQFAPGYFYQTGAVTYTGGNYPDGCDDTVETGHKLASFLIWRYCFNFDMPGEWWVPMLLAYANSTQLFPLPEEFSYAANLDLVVKNFERDSRRRIF